MNLAEKLWDRVRRWKTTSLNELLEWAQEADDLIENVLEAGRLVTGRDVAIANLNVELSTVSQQLDEAREEIEAGNKLLEDHNDLLRMIPACRIHGDQCIPNAKEWVEKFKALHGVYEEIQKIGAGWTNSEWARLVVSANVRLAETKTELAELAASFELYDEASRRGIKMWQEATGENRVWPDQADLIVWLMDRLDAYENNICLQCDLTMEAVLFLADKDTINEATGEEEITLSSGEITTEGSRRVIGCVCEVCLIGYSSLCSEKDDKEQ